MTDLETRLRSLREQPASWPSPTDLRERAARRGRHRKVAATVVVLLVATAGGTAVWTTQDEPAGETVSGPDPSTADPSGTIRDSEPPSPTASISPDTDLEDNQKVTLTAHGLRPNSSVSVEQCRGVDLTVPVSNCDVLDPVVEESDSGGSLAATIAVRAAIYGHQGRTDCVEEVCALMIRSGRDGATIPLEFGSHVEAPEPQLRLDPPGSYVDDQTISIHGTDFPQGADIQDQLGMCPADDDAVLNGGCAHWLEGANFAGDDGEFTATVRLDSLTRMAVPCGPEPECVIAWVIPKGPIGASVRLELSD